MIPMLIRQNIKFGFFIVNQSNDGFDRGSTLVWAINKFYLTSMLIPDFGSLFNRAKLLNIGFDYTAKLNEFDCFIFHDVDLILQDDRAIYHCIEGVAQHYSGFIDKFAYKLLYQRIFGGITG